MTATESIEESIEATRRAVAANTTWYHVIELAPGVVTPGQIDLREAARKILPPDLAGKRVLDVGTFDGFWAFELERRGAEVVAIDVEAIDEAEWPPLNRPRLLRDAEAADVVLGRGFRIAHEALGSAVRRVVCPVYDLTAEAIGGPVDFVFAGAIMLHLRDPVRALEAIHGALQPGGTLLQAEPLSWRATVRFPRRPVAEFQPLTTPFNWWYPNLAALLAWPTAAGLVDVHRTAFFRPRATKEMTQLHAAVVSRRGP